MITHLKKLLTHLTKKESKICRFRESRAKRSYGSDKFRTDGGRRKRRRSSSKE